MGNLLVLSKEAIEAMKAESYAKGYADAIAATEQKKSKAKKTPSKSEITVEDETYQVRNAVVD